MCFCNSSYDITENSEVGRAEGSCEIVLMAFLPEGETDVQAGAQCIWPLWSLWSRFSLVGRPSSQNRHIGVWGHQSPLELLQIPQGAPRSECAGDTGQTGSHPSLIMAGDEAFAGRALGVECYEKPSSEKPSVTLRCPCPPDCLSGQVSRPTLMTPRPSFPEWRCRAVGVGSAWPLSGMSPALRLLSPSPC